MWHRLTSNRDATARDLFDFYFHYAATAAIVNEPHPSGDLMADVALTLMDAMERRTEGGIDAVSGDGDESPETQMGLDDLGFLNEIIISFPEYDYDARRIALNAIVHPLARGCLTDS